MGMDCALFQLLMDVGVVGGASKWHVVFLSPVVGPGWWAYI